MICKHCGAEMEESLICPVCGEAHENMDEQVVPAEEMPEEIREDSCAEAVPEADQAAENEVVAEATEEEQPQKKVIFTPGRIAILLVLCVLILGAVGAGIWYGINGGWTPRENVVQYKDSYTAEAAELTKKADKVVATIGDKKLTNAQLQIYYWMQVYNFLDYYGAYASYIGLDYTKPLDTQVMPTNENMTWQQYFIEQSLKSWQRYQALGILAEEAGFQIEDALRQQLDAMPEQMEQMAANAGNANAQEMLMNEMGPGATTQSYMEYLNLYYLGSEYFEELYQTQKPTQAQVEAYFEANAGLLAESGITKETKTVAVRHILLFPENGTTDAFGMPAYSDEDWEACRVQAQGILDDWLAGAADEKSFADLANTYSADPGSNTNGGLYDAIEKGTTYPPFDAWCFDSSRKPGDSGLVKSDMGYHIMYFVGDNYIWYQYCESALWDDLATTALDAAMMKNPLEVNYKNILLGNVDLTGG